MLYLSFQIRQTNKLMRVVISLFILLEINLASAGLETDNQQQNQRSTNLRKTKAGRRQYP